MFVKGIVAITYSPLGGSNIQWGEVTFWLIVYRIALIGQELLKFLVVTTQAPVQKTVQTIEREVVLA